MTHEERKAERRAEARIAAPTDIGLQLQRTMSMTKGLLDLLEDEYKEFRAANRGVPKGFERRLQDVANLLDSLTLSYSRFRKAEKEWEAGLSDEEKADHLAQWVLAQYQERPDAIARWLHALVLDVNAAGDTTHSLAELIQSRKPDTRKLTVDEIIEQGARRKDWPDED